MSGLTDSKGREYQRIPVVELGDLKLPIREVNPDALKQMGETVALGLLTQVNDQNAMLWAGMMMLAKDIYERDKVHPGVPVKRNFEEFADKTGLTVTGLGGDKLSVAEFLKKIG